MNEPEKWTPGCGKKNGHSPLVSVMLVSGIRPRQADGSPRSEHKSVSYREVLVGAMRREAWRRGRTGAGLVARPPPASVINELFTLARRRAHLTDGRHRKKQLAPHPDARADPRL
ncbi:hypothetical protein E2C01_069759 [Portunus trituberculatus]|uniref:Uncharacterized protein n=1 Tax=Portunus trituberculatus TaxID=210409 RepID=A0A5B7HZE6_PORTR|nr:hypothetical protein [Portunus trituberculatus]